MATINSIDDLVNFIKTYTYDDGKKEFNKPGVIISINNVTISETIKNTTTIYINSQNITDTHIKTFASLLNKFTSLEILYLSVNKIGDSGAIHLANNLPASLTHFALSSNKIGDTGVIKLAKKLPSSLKELNLYDNMISDAGAIELAKNLPVSLEILYLGVNKIGDLGAI